MDINDRIDKAVNEVMDKSGLSKWDAEIIVGGVVKALDDNGISLVINDNDDEG